MAIYPKSTLDSTSTDQVPTGSDTSRSALYRDLRNRDRWAMDDEDELSEGTLDGGDALLTLTSENEEILSYEEGLLTFICGGSESVDRKKRMRMGTL